MKILIVMDGYFPGQQYGGPPVSIDNFCTFMDQNECYIVTKNHDLKDKTPYPEIQNGWNARRNCKVMYLSDSEYNKSRFEKITRQVNPDIIYLQGLFQSCVIPYLYIAKKLRIELLLAPRGELCHGAFNLKKTKKVLYTQLVRRLGLVKNVYFQSTSLEETNMIETILGVEKKRIFNLVNFPTDIESVNTNNYKKEKGSAKFIFLSRIHPKKNLLEALKIFIKIEGNVVFDIYGPIEDQKYWQECQDELSNIPANVSVNYCGLVPHENVVKVFQMYDAFVLPTLSENYGHVIVESLLAGTPVIISDQTPWNDLNETGSNWALPLTDMSLFQIAINAVIEYDQQEMTSARMTARSYIEKKLNLEGLVNDYNKALHIITDTKEM